MILGAILVICGILIAVYPPLLSLIVAALLIFLGVFMLLLVARLKKSEKQFEDPFLNFFIKM